MAADGWEQLLTRVCNELAMDAAARIMFMALKKLRVVVDARSLFG